MTITRRKILRDCYFRGTVEKHKLQGIGTIGVRNIAKKRAFGRCSKMETVFASDGKTPLFEVYLHYTKGFRFRGATAKLRKKPKHKWKKYLRAFSGSAAA